MMTKQESGWTIVLPIWDGPNVIAAALEGLARYSAYRHTILIAYSDVDRVETAGLQGYHGNELAHCGWSPQKPFPNFVERKYATTADLVVRLGHIDYPHEIRVVDMTEESITIRRQMGPQTIENFIRVGYAEIGMKLDLAMNFVETDTVLPYWEDDYYPCPNWDAELMETMQQDSGYLVYVPTLVRHWMDLTHDPYPAHVKDPWEDFRSINCHSVYINAPYPLTRKIWEQYCQDMWRPSAYIERCGERLKGFAFPLLMPTELRKQITLPKDGADAPLYLDSALGDMGYAKVISKRSLIGNKMPVLVTAEELP